MAKKFKYNRRSAKSVEARAHQGASSREGFLKNEFKMYIPKAGDNVLRILPPTWDDPDHYGIDVYVNYGIGPDKASYASLSKMLSQPDPIAEERDRALAEGDEEYAKSLRPSKRVLLWVIDRNKEEEGPMLWPAPWTVDRDLSLLCKDKRTGEILFIDDPENGYDIEFTKTGTGMTTKYEGLLISRRDSPLNGDEEIQEKWLNYVVENPLPSTILYYDYDHIKKVFEGAPRTENSDGSSDDSKASSRSSRKSKDEELTYEGLCEMSLNDLDVVCEDHKLHLFADDFDNAKDMAEAICALLDIEVPAKKEEPRRSRTRKTEPEPEKESSEDDQQPEEDEPEQEAEEPAKQEKEEKTSGRKSRLAGLRRR